MIKAELIRSVKQYLSFEGADYQAYLAHIQFKEKSEANEDLIEMESDPNKKFFKGEMINLNNAF